MWRTRVVVVAVAVVATAFRAAPADDPAAPGRNPSTGVSAVLASPPSTTFPAPATVATAAPTTPPPPRIIHDQAWTPFATVADSQVVLHHPSARVERVGFHQSNNDGARALDPVSTAASPVTLEGRDRGTGERTAADVVVDPDSEIRAAVTGTVRRAGSYVLYCDNRDEFVVIEPAARPGWEVKMLHISGVRVRAGQRVVAGETVVARHATVLPFASQVEEITAKPPWPHVHIEVVDPSIRDRPSGRRC